MWSCYHGKLLKISLPHIVFLDKILLSDAVKCLPFRYEEVNKYKRRATTSQPLEKNVYKSED